MYPSIKLPPTPQNPALNRYLKFDRILADVPCSGDGTMRKNVNLWKDWQPGNALGLHITQVRILVRALQMLKVGGRVVYSTCSMNPVENEAVIGSAIERCGGLKMVQLLPSDDQLPLLKRAPGLKKWSVMDKVGDTWSSMEEVEEYDKKYGSTIATEKLTPGMFAPKVGSGEEEIPFERCMRVYGNIISFQMILVDNVSQLLGHCHRPLKMSTERRLTRPRTHARYRWIFYRNPREESGIQSEA
jgi:multisite-specific tRNA:(cytosine-C5)-methyltransferase